MTTPGAPVTPGSRLARLLGSRGILTDPLWHRAIIAVDRTAFVPDTLYGSDPAHPGWECPVPRTDPRWDAWVQEDYALATQVDDGHPQGEHGRGRLVTSSLSQPSLVVAMLQALDAREGHRVLEIGTGAGYNTALLCHALSDRAVVSVEIDRDLAKTAIGNLARAGYAPTVLDDDGISDPFAGVAMGRFHRLLATVAARGRVPYSWVRQLYPGGVLVTPWEVGNTPGVLLRLEVEEGHAAHGRIIGDASFMVLRSHRSDRRSAMEVVNEESPGAVDATTSVNPRLVAYRNQGWQLVLGHLVPELRYAVYEAAEDRPECAGEASVYVATPQDGSWALGEYVPAGGPYRVKREGARDLWAAVGAAWEVWERAGRPGRDRLGVTVDERGTHLWADGPEGVLQLDGDGRSGRRAPAGTG
ncbi:rRNA adenine N-6-methyltransferase family protein [Nocardiopsis flavescens]|uniref:rRNA adenine N-6-methyltransferase family protein n=1 Tax=Nocardiopsis flavescens TaxID=758803 RepID=UPI00364FCAB2